MKHILSSLIVLLLAIGLIAIGLTQDQHKAVERKSTTVCLECIGIG